MSQLRFERNYGPKEAKEVTHLEKGLDVTRRKNASVCRSKREEIDELEIATRRKRTEGGQKPPKYFEKVTRNS